jgi:hypothetical protein
MDFRKQRESLIGDMLMHGISKRDFWGMILLLALFSVLNLSCGYRLRSSIGSLPDGSKSIGIPAFKNLTNEFKIEQVITQAVIKEFSARTRGRVNSSSSDVDLVLRGEIRSLELVPVTYRTQNVGEKTFGSAFQITLRVSVKLERTSDSAIIWKNDDFVFRERYILNSNIRDFFSEDNPAIERMAQNFASGLASTILYR